MKRFLLLIFLLVPCLAMATDFDDADQLYGWDSSTGQFYQTWADHKTQLSLLYQALDADLTTYAGITPSANVQSLLGAADYAAFFALIDDTLVAANLTISGDWTFSGNVDLPADTVLPAAAVAGSQTGVHATPSTTNPLAPTWVTAIHTVWYGATGEIDLPAAAGYTGRGILIYNTGAFTITIDPDGTEVIVRAGTVQTGGVSMTLASGAGNYVALISDGARWVTVGYAGVIAEGT